MFFAVSHSKGTLALRFLLPPRQFAAGFEVVNGLDNIHNVGRVADKFYYLVHRLVNHWRFVDSVIADRRGENAVHTLAESVERDTLEGLRA